MTKLKEVITNILNFEKTEKLFELQFKSRPIWPYFRMYFFYKYAEEIKLYNKPSSSTKTSFSYLINILRIFNFIKLFKKKGYFVLEHSRTNNEGIDIYTNELVSILGKNNCSFFSFTEQGKTNKSSEVIILDFIKIFSKIFSKIFYRFSENKYYKINFNSFLANLEISNKKKYDTLFKRYHIELVIQYYFYFYLLKMKHTKKVVLTVSYLNLPLVYAAKNLDIEVIELQHGVISNYHLGYHFPYYEKDFFPDKLYTFGKYWKDSASFPKNCQVISIGNDYMTEQNINKKTKEKNTILVISQGTIGKKLENYILSNKDILTKYKIYFKLHPSEFNEINIKYEELLKIKNIECITTQDNISNLQSKCEYQIGIYSTAVFEGIEKECKTILLNDVGIEYMENLIKNNIVSLVNYDSPLATALEKATKPEGIVFFQKFNRNNIDALQ